MTDLKWVCCPYCGEITDLHRQGSTGEYIHGANGKLKGITHSDRVKCGFCGETFRTMEPTIMEAFGRDSVGDTPY